MLGSELAGAFEVVGRAVAGIGEQLARGLAGVGRPRWILRLVRAGVPLSGEPLFRWLVSHCDAAG